MVKKNNLLSQMKTNTFIIPDRVQISFKKKSLRKYKSDLTKGNVDI